MVLSAGSESSFFGVFFGGKREGDDDDDDEVNTRVVGMACGRCRGKIRFKIELAKGCSITSQGLLEVKIIRAIRVIQERERESVCVCV